MRRDVKDYVPETERLLGTNSSVSDYVVARLSGADNMGIEYD